MRLRPRRLVQAHLQADPFRRDVARSEGALGGEALELGRRVGGESERPIVATWSAYAFEETLGVASPTGEDLPPERIVAMFRDYLLSLPADRFPHVHRAAGDLFGGDADERFEFGLDVILRGIGTYAQPDEARDGGRAG